MDIPCAAIKVDGRLKTWGADRLPIHRDSVALADSPAFRAHYPEFTSYYEGDPAEPQHNVLVHNVFCNVAHVFEKVVWSEHYYNDIIEGRANFFDEMRDNVRMDAPTVQIRLPEGIPPTSQHELHFVHDAFSGIRYGIADEKQTAASTNQD